MVEDLARPEVAAVLDALREADRFIHVAGTTHARELQEAAHERRVGRGRFEDLAIGYAAAQPTVEHDGDGVAAERELGEAVEAVERAIMALPEDSPVRAGLTGGLQLLQGNFMWRSESLYRTVRAAFEQLRAGDATVAPLPTWNVDDDEDAAIARAAGTDLVGRVRRQGLGVVLLLGLGLLYLYAML